MLTYVLSACDGSSNLLLSTRFEISIAQLYDPDKNKADVLDLKTHLVAIPILFCKATEIPSGWLKGSLFSCLSIFVVPLILKTNIRKADNGASTTSIKI